VAFSGYRHPNVTSNMLLLTKQQLFSPTAFHDTLASGYGEFGVVSAADPAVSADNFVLGSSQSMSVHLLQSTHCRFYVPTTEHTHYVI